MTHHPSILTQYVKDPQYYVAKILFCFPSSMYHLRESTTGITHLKLTPWFSCSVCSGTPLVSFVLPWHSLILFSLSISRVVLLWSQVSIRTQSYAIELRYRATSGARPYFFYIPEFIPYQIYTGGRCPTARRAFPRLHNAQRAYSHMYPRGYFRPLSYGPISNCHQ